MHTLGSHRVQSVQICGDSSQMHIIIIIIYDLLLRGRDGGTNFILRIKEQQTRLNLQEHHDDDDDDDDTLPVSPFLDLLGFLRKRRSCCSSQLFWPGSLPWATLVFQHSPLGHTGDETEI